MQTPGRGGAGTAKTGGEFVQCRSEPAKHLRYCFILKTFTLVCFCEQKQLTAMFTLGIHNILGF